MRNVSIRKVNMVKIGPVKYKIERQPPPIHEREEALGLCDYLNGSVVVDNRLQNDVEATTIMHEALHALYWHAGVKKHEEKVIEVISGMLIRFIQDNPKLIEAIQKLK